MADRHYVSDYRLEEHVAPDGTAQSERVYQGTYYRFCRDAGEIRSLGKQILLVSALIIVCLLPLLLNNTQIGRTFYVLLPVVFTLLPLYHLGAVGVRLLRYRQPLTRQMRDLTDCRLRQASVWLQVLLGGDSLGCIGYWISKGLQKGELLCVVGIFLALLLSLIPLRQRKYAETVES